MFLAISAYVWIFDLVCWNSLWKLLKTGELTTSMSSFLKTCP